MSYEKQIQSNNDSLDISISINNELDEIYRNQAEALIVQKNQAEYAASPPHERLFKIANNIAEARSNRLDSQYHNHIENKNNFIKSVSKKLFNIDIPQDQHEPLTEGRLKKEESAIGSIIFGTTKPNERIEFFNEDRGNWFFYQGLIDSAGQPKSVTIRYEVLETGVLRSSSIDYSKNELIQGSELDNFMNATHMYHELVMSQIYNKDNYPGKKAA